MLIDSSCDDVIIAGTVAGGNTGVVIRCRYNAVLNFFRQLDRAQMWMPSAHTVIQVCIEGDTGRRDHLSESMQKNSPSFLICEIMSVAYKHAWICSLQNFALR